jgi:hypothetical protein
VSSGRYSQTDTMRSTIETGDPVPSGSGIVALDLAGSQQDSPAPVESAQRSRPDRTELSWIAAPGARLGRR